MKFKSDIEVQAGLRDGSDDIGTAGQILSSTGSKTNWINQDAIISAASKLVVIACKNTSGATIAKGTPVYQTGTVGATDVIEIAEADASDEDKMAAIGLLQTDINNNDFGNVVITGELLNLTTDPIDGITPTTGDTIYVKSGGGLTLTKPTGLEFIQNVGLVGKVSGGNSGSLTVSSIMRSNDVPTPLYIDHDNQRLGVGETSPDVKLHVAGDSTAAAFSTVLKVESTANEGSVQDVHIYNQYDRDIGIKFETLGGENYIWQDSNGDDALVFSSGGANRTNDATLIINQSHNVLVPNGNVGIGTTSPTNGKLVIDSTANQIAVETGTAGDGRLNIGHFSNGTFIGTYGDDGGAADLIRFGTHSGDERMRISSSGNVGIGTTNPAQNFVVADATNGNGIELVPGATATFQTYNRGTSSYNNLNIDTARTQVRSIDYTSFHNGSGYPEKIRITSSGNLGINTTQPSEKLDVDGNARVRNLTAGIVTSSATGVLSTGGPTPMNMSLGESYAANIREKYYRTNRTVYPSTIGSQFAQLIQQDLLNSMSLIMSPVATQTSEVSSVRPENNSGDFSFTRATKASRVASSGYIVRQTENYIRYSNEFNNSSYWTLGDATVTWGQADYFGKSTAWKLQDTASTAQHFVRQTTGIGGVVTVSVYAKAGTKSFLYLRGVEGTTSKETFFNLSAGTVGTVEGITASMETIGNGWYRCSASFDHNPPYEYYFGVADADNVPSYTGDGTGNIYIVNAQIESGIGVREYNATTSSMFYGGETINVPRIDYKNGVPELLLEKTSTNVVYCSAKMAGLTEVTQSFTLSPEGILNGIKINETSASNQHYGHVNCSVVAGTQYFLSFYIKKGTSSSVTIYTQSNTIGSNATVNLNNGTISASGTDSFIEDVGGGWYRAGYKTPAASQTATSMDIYLPVSGLNSYTGDVDNYTEYYGIQLETAPIVTSHIPTYDGAVTRNNEIIALSHMATNTIAANATAATLMVEFSNNYTNAGDTLQWHSSSTIVGRGYFYVRQIGFADTWGASGFSTTDGVNTKVIWRLNSLTSGSFFKDGVKSGQTVTGTAWSDINKLVIRSDFGTMRIRNIFMASTDLTDDQCIKLTTINE